VVHPAGSSSHRASYAVLGALILLCLAVGWAGSLVTVGEIPTWYAALEWTPDRTSSLLLVPYLLWVTYASTLNAGIWVMN
jgi:tryptophan-rich sensory protein